MSMTNDRSDESEVFQPHLKDIAMKQTAFWETAGPEIEYPRNTILCEDGDLPDCCYYIKKGVIVSFDFTTNGEENIYNISNEGALLLESNVLLRKRIGTNFKTLVPTTVVKISREKLNDIIKNNSLATIDIITSVSEKFWAANDQIKEMSNHSAYWKTCNLLLSFAGHYGTEYDGKRLISFKLSQQLIANCLRINRVTVSNVIGDLKAAGLLDIVNGHYCIRDINKLYEHANKMDKIFFKN